MTWNPCWPTGCSSPSRSCSITCFPIGTMGLAPFVAAYTWKAAARRCRRRSAARALLDQDLRDQLCGRRRYRYPDGVPVRNELGRVFAPQRGGHRPAARDGGHLRVLPRVGFSRRAALRRGAAAPVAIRGVGGGAGVAGLVALGLLHRRDRRVDAASGRLSSRGPDGTIRAAEHRRRAVLAVGDAGSSPTCLPARWSPGGIRRRRHRRVLSAREAREAALARRFVRCGVDRRHSCLRCSRSFPTGDGNGGDVTDYQPVKLAAMEGLFETTPARRSRSSGCPTCANANADRSDLRTRIF